MKICLSVLAIFLLSCVSGSAIVVGEVKNPIDPSRVKLYLEMLEDYEVIGIVTASTDAGWTEQGSVDYAVEELKNQAAISWAPMVF